MRSIDPSTIPHAEAHRYLLACVAPRPIAFVGTQNSRGEVNLSPFSFFNAFGANPPVIAFSPAFRGTDGSAKHTFLNIKETGEFTVSVVNYSMIEQMSLASAEWPEGVDEFVKGGFTKLPSQKISPPGVGESPMVMECRLLHHVDLGSKPGSGNLMIGEVVMFHIKESVFDGNYPHYQKLDLVARMGGPYYCRANGDAVFELPKPVGLGIGFDGLPEEIRESCVLTGNHLGKLAGVAKIPDLAEVEAFWRGIEERVEVMPDDLAAEMRGGDPDRVLVAMWVESAGLGDEPEKLRTLLHRTAAWLLDHGNTTDAWFILMVPQLLSRKKENV